MNKHSAFDVAMQLNNDGASCLSNGEEDRALVAFKHALIIIQRELPPSGVEGDEISGNEAEESSTDADTNSALHGSRKIKLTPVQVECPSLENSYVYNRALAVHGGQGGKGKKEMNLLSAVIIFNMALLHDLRGIRCKSTKYRVRSLRLYEMCYGLLEEFDRKTLHIDTIMLLSIVCLNNMSQVTLSEGDFSRCQWMMRTLQSLLTSQSKSNQLNEHDIRGLMLNVMMMHPPTSASAA